jgi:hypothetical protein
MLPDLAPLDYFLWRHMKDLVYLKKIIDKEELSQRIILLTA